MIWWNMRAMALLAALAMGQLLPGTALAATDPVRPEVLTNPSPSPSSPPNSAMGVDPMLVRMVKQPLGADRFPNAGVHVIFHDERVDVNADGSYTRTIHEAYRILNHNGQDDYSEVAQNYSPDTDRLTVNFAATLTPDGQVIPVQANAIKDSSPYSDYPAYDRVKVRTFTFPATDPGAIVDYQLTLVSHQPMMDHDFADEFLFHGTQPIRDLRYTVSVPKERPLRFMLLHPWKQAPVQFRLERQGHRLIYHWEARDLPSLPVDAEMPSWGDVLPRLMVTTATSWDEVASWWSRLIKGKTALTPRIRALVGQLVKGKRTPDEKARAIYDYVVRHVRYVYVDLTDAGFEPQSAQSVLTDQYGDCKSGSTLLIAMLRAAGVPAYYALLRTNDEDALVKGIPSPYQFDHCIVAAEVRPGHFTFLDNVGKTTPYGVVPDMDQGVPALVFDGAKAVFRDVPLAAAETNTLHVSQRIALTPTGGVTVTETDAYQGEEDDEIRSFYQTRTPSQIREAFEEDSVSEAPGSRLIGFTLSDVQDLDTPVVSTLTYTSEGYAITAGDIMMFRVPGFMEGMTDMERERRTWPFERHLLSEEVDDTDIVLPRGWKVRYLPPPIDLHSPMVTFKAGYRQDGDRLFFRAVTDFTRTDVSAEQYPEVRELFQQRAHYSKQLVVLQRE